MKTYRTAIIGCGRRAYGHANAYRLISNAKLVACSNKSDLSRRQKFANTYNTASYASAKRMIEEEKPDLVHLVTMPDQMLIKEIKILQYEIQRRKATVIAERQFKSIPESEIPFWKKHSLN